MLEPLQYYLNLKSALVADDAQTVLQFYAIDQPALQCNHQILYPILLIHEMLLCVKTEAFFCILL